MFAILTTETVKDGYEIIPVINLSVTWKKNCTCDIVNFVHIKNNSSPNSMNLTRKGKIQMTLLKNASTAFL